MEKTPLPPETSLDDVKVRIMNSYRNPNVRTIHQVVLKEGPRTFRTATLMEIIDPKTGALHHYSLKLDSIDRLKSGWFAKPEKSIRLEGDNPDEITHLCHFLTALTEGKLAHRTGELHIVNSEDYAKLEKLVDMLPNLPSSDKLELVKAILPHIQGETVHHHDLVSMFKRSDPEVVRHISIASRIVEYRKAYERLVQLVDDEATSEPDLERHLQQNPWMFGSEYSELMDRRTWTRDDSLDFMLRRTVDDFLEIVEIKTPFKDHLLIHDKSHDSYYPSSKLSPVIGQVMRYIEEVERDRDSILAKDGFDTLKIRARIIIGRDDSQYHQIALRNLNAHLHRIEIITFDQLLKIAGRVLAVFEGQPDDSDTSSCSDQSDLTF